MRWILSYALVSSVAIATAQDKPAAPVKKAAKAEEAPKPRRFTVTVGQTVRLQMTSKKPIGKVFNEKPLVVQVAPTDDPTTVQVTGVSPGFAKITLIDRDGREEVHEAGPPLK